MQPVNQETKHRHYRAYMQMYAGMIRDLSHCEHYLDRLIDAQGLDEFETALRARIEKHPKE